jgi:hypothetical protein
VSGGIVRLGQEHLWNKKHQHVNYLSPTLLRYIMEQAVR